MDSEKSKAKSAIDQFSLGEVERVIAGLQARRVIKFGVGTPSEQVKRLRENWPCFNWVEEYVIPPSHPFVAYSRIAFTLWALGEAGNSRVKDIGGDWFLHWVWDTYAHCCCPLMDARDGARQTKRELQMEQKIDHFGFLKSPGQVCHLRAEECTEQADICLCVDSAHDMGLGGLCKAMDKAGARKLYGNILFDTDMLLREKMSGYVHGMGFHWRKVNRESVATGVEKTILFEGTDYDVVYHFEDNTLLNYTHKLSDIISVACGSYFEVAGKWYELERTKLCDGMLMFTINASTGSHSIAAARSELFRPMMKDHIVVKFPKLISWRRQVGEFEMFTLRKDLVFAVTSLAFGAFRENKDAVDQLEAIVGALSAKPTTIIINGQSYQVGWEKLDPFTFPYVAAGLYLHARRSAEGAPEGVEGFARGGLLTWFKKKWADQVDKLEKVFGTAFTIELILDDMEFIECEDACYSALKTGDVYIDEEEEICKALKIFRETQKREAEVDDDRKKTSTILPVVHC